MHLSLNGILLSSLLDFLSWIINDFANNSYFILLIKHARENILGKQTLEKMHSLYF